MSAAVAAAVVRVLPGVPESASAARALAREVLGAGHPAAGTAALVVSELVTNAIAYSRSGLPGGLVVVTIQVSPGEVLVHVRDDGGRGAPVPAESAPGAEHGYGLRIIAALAASWGTAPTAAGRATWCRLTGPGKCPCDVTVQAHDGGTLTLPGEDQ